MKILLTGACGLVGRAIMRQGAGEHEFVAIDVAEQVESLDGGVRGSIIDEKLIMRIAEGCDAIIHTAAMHGTSRNKRPNRDFIETNVFSAEYLFQAALKHGIKRLVFSSTLEVLCGYGWGASGVTVYDATTPPRPDWIYPVSKLMVEELGHFYAAHHALEVVQLRYAWVRYVPIEEIGLGLLARSVADSDVAQANLLSATTPGLRDEVFNIGPDTPLTLADIMTARDKPWAVLERHWPGCTDYLKRAGDEPKWDQFWPVADITDARRALNWTPAITVSRYLQTLGWCPKAASEKRKVETLP